MKKHFSITETHFTPDKAAELIELIHEPVFAFRDLGITMAILRHWRKHDLTISDTEMGTKRPKYSLLEFVWLNILKTVNRFDNQIVFLKHLKEQLAEPIGMNQLAHFIKLSKSSIHKTDIEKQYSNTTTITPDSNKGAKLKLEYTISPLEIILTDFLIKRNNLTLRILDTGEVFPYMEEKSALYRELDVWKYVHNHHICISFTSILSGIVASEKSDEITARLEILSEDEAEVLTLLRIGKLKTLSIRFNEKHQIQLLEATEQVSMIDQQARYVDHILRNGYQEIKYKTQAGKIVSFERTTLKKFK
jgi:hypothetical protein